MNYKKTNASRSRKNIFAGSVLMLIILCGNMVMAQNSKFITPSSIKKINTGDDQQSWTSSFSKHYASQLTAFYYHEMHDSAFFSASNNGLKIFSSKPEMANAVIIIPFPEALYFFNTDIILSTLHSIHDAAIKNENRCYMMTPQPRADGEFARSEMKLWLASVKDSILSAFGVENTIDAWNGFYTPSDSSLLAIYDAGDSYHLNSSGQKALFEKILDKNIFHLQSESLRGDIKSGAWFDILAPCICYFAVFPDAIRRLKNDIAQKRETAPPAN
jgi:hypothetical protein